MPTIVAQTTKKPTFVPTTAFKQIDVPESNVNPDIDQLVERGLALLDSDVKEALRIATEVTRTDPTNPWGWVLMGLGQVCWEQAEQALHSGQQALRLDPALAIAYEVMGRAHLGLGRADDALKQFERAAQIEPGLVHFQSLCGLALLVGERSSEAVAVLEKCHRELPDDETISDWLARAYVDARLDTWVRGEDGQFYPTEKVHVIRALESVGKAAQLRPADPELQQAIAEAQREAEGMLKPRFVGSWWRHPLQMMIMLAVGGGIGGVVGAIYGLTPLLIGYSLWLPQYVVNKRIVHGPNLIDRALLAAGSRTSRTHNKDYVGMAIGVIILAALPAVMAYNSYRKLQDTGVVGAKG